MRKNFLTFGKPDIQDSEINEVIDTLKSGWLGTGPKTKLFERKFAQYANAKFAIALNSCTAGLHLALDALEIAPGDEVITTPMTFPATINVIEHVGAKPVFVDIKKKTLNIDESEIESVISKSTKAIIPVHLAGMPCEMNIISSIAQKYNIKVIEDAAHSIESYYKGKKIGSISDMTCFSFYVTKNLVTGEGGMVTTNDKILAEKIRISSLHGISKDAWKRFSEKGYSHYETLYPGYKYNMTDIQSSLGIHQLSRMKSQLKIRNNFWKQYDEAFKNIPEIDLPDTIEGVTHSRHLYIIILRLSKLKISRDEFMFELKKRNIGSGVHYTAVHNHKFYRDKYSYAPEDFPNANWVSSRNVSLPLSSALGSDDIDDVINAVVDIISCFKK